MPVELKSLKLSDFLSLELPPKQYIFDPILPEKGLMEIFAAPGVGKTTFALALGVCASLGKTFIKWNVRRPYKVLYIDGEMSTEDMQHRLGATVQYFGLSTIEEDNFRLLSQNYDCGIKDIRTEAGQEYLQPEVDWAELIFIDNLSSLSFSGKENDADDWAIMQRWLLRLRAEGKSIVLIHHAGKNGSSRGTSRKHDILDTVIKLERPHSYQQSDGAKFELHFDKTRSFFGDAADPVGLTYTIEDGIACWETFLVGSEKPLEVAELLKQGHTQQKVAEMLNISQPEVSKRKARAVAQGLY